MHDCPHLATLVASGLTLKPLFPRFSLVQYDKPTAWCTPENLHLKEMLKELADDAEVSLDFVIDLHSHSTAMNAFCYINMEENDMRKMQSELFFLRLFSQENAQFSLSSSRGLLSINVSCSLHQPVPPVVSLCDETVLCSYLFCSPNLWCGYGCVLMAYTRSQRFLNVSSRFPHGFHDVTFQFVAIRANSAPVDAHFQKLFRLTLIATPSKSPSSATRSLCDVLLMEEKSTANLMISMGVYF